MELAAGVKNEALNNKPVKALTDREIEVANQVFKGLSNREIGTKLFISEKCVKFHVTNIFKKYKVKSRAQLMVKLMAERGVCGQE